MVAKFGMALVVLLLCLSACSHNSPDKYVDNYFAVIGISHRSYSYHTLVRRFGASTEIVAHDTNPDWRVVHFGDIAFLMNYNNTASRPSRTVALSGFRVYGESVRFGRYQIGVGSTGHEVEHAFCSHQDSAVSTFDSIAGGGLVAIDGTTWLWFYLDESNLVTSISITHDGP